MWTINAGRLFLPCLKDLSRYCDSSLLPYTSEASMYEVNELIWSLAEPVRTAGPGWNKSDIKRPSISGHVLTIPANYLKIWHLLFSSHSVSLNF